MIRLTDEEISKLIKPIWKQYPTAESIARVIDKVRTAQLKKVFDEAIKSGIIKYSTVDKLVYGVRNKRDLKFWSELLKEIEG
jgi:chaperone required for assembly of F1-ATPase